MSFDLSVFTFINGWAHQSWLLDYFGVFFAEYFGYFLILIAIILILKESKWQGKIHFFSLISLSLILSRGIIAEIIKFFVSRPRPFSILEIQPLIKYSAYDIGMSFPSGHASFFFALAGAIIFYFWNSEDKYKKMWGWRFLAAAFLMGLARIFVGVHWPLDILVGAVIGLISSYAIKKLLDVEFKKKAPYNMAL